ncbi:MAG: [FeFe] hydrogenase H-cluster maturation GTPase HydF [Bacteroidales bacterium]|nr:[FeFe] hydrogenase H-cluster maturation GTPase HydF [Bacteroidales bacterium]
MAKDLKPHIGIFGRRNSGKSSLINRLTGQQIAIVSDTAGTTTDPVKKSIEIFGVGPCVLIDTAGIDDVGELGKQRVDKTMKVLEEIDCAILVVTGNQFGDPEEQLVSRMKALAVPFFVVHNKADEEPLLAVIKAVIERKCHAEILDFSVMRNDDIAPLVEVLKKTIPESAYQKVSLLGGIIKPNEVVVLVCPVDSEAPEGRLILPQVMAIRDVLDNECICVVLKESLLQQYLDTMPQPALIVTDSQVFGFVSKIVPQEIPLTSFSIVMARLRGDFDNYMKGTPCLSQLKDGDTVLLLESCTHHSTCEDIGRVKLPRMIRQFTGKDIQFEYVAGLAPIPEVKKYAMAIQCGGCMSTRKQLLNRTNLFVNQGVPVSNYGMALAYMNGIFNRVMRPFV